MNKPQQQQPTNQTAPAATSQGSPKVARPQNSPKQQTPSKPNYNVGGFVIGGRDDRGVRKPYGKFSAQATWVSLNVLKF